MLPSSAGRPIWSARVSASRSGSSRPSSRRSVSRGSLRLASTSQPAGRSGRKSMRDRLAVPPVGRHLQDRRAGQAAMGEQGRLAKPALARARHDLGRHARQGREQRLLARQGQRHQRRPRLDDLEAEAARHVIGEAGRAELGDRQAAGRQHQRRRLVDRVADRHMKRAVAMLDLRRLPERGLDLPGGAFVEQHRARSASTSRRRTIARASSRARRCRAGRPAR